MRRLRQPDTGIGTFVDMAEIGTGSFARVFRAVDRETGQHVALKVLDLHRSRGPNRDLFQIEARALGALSAHPHIVTLHRAFISREGVPVLVLELCETSLATMLDQRGALAPQDAVSITIKLAGALATAHDAGILHRDLKPANVLMTRYGEPALSDFGVAQMRDTAGSGSPTSAMTLYHAAPEIIVGSSGDERSDLYSLASTLYECIAGHPPHYVTANEDPLVVQRRVQADAAPRIRSHDLPLQLHDLLQRSLAKQPESRPATVVEFVRLLRGVEVTHGWPATNCLVGGRNALLPLLPAPVVQIPSNRAASNTSLPSLGVNTRPFASIDLSQRRLDPVDRNQPQYTRSDRPAVSTRRPGTPLSGGPEPSTPAARAAPRPGGLLQRLAEHPEHSGAITPQPPATAEAAPSDESFHPVQAIWGYGSEGGTGTVVRQDASLPSPAGTDPGPSKRRRFGRKRTT